MFASPQLRRPLPTRPMRWVALGCVMLMGLLSLASVSPQFHTALHGGSQTQDEHAEHRNDPANPADSGHSCAVTLFSQGIESGGAPVVLVGVPERVLADVVALADQVARAARATQLPPGRGPPVC